MTMTTYSWSLLLVDGHSFGESFLSLSHTSGQVRTRSSRLDFAEVFGDDDGCRRFVLDCRGVDSCRDMTESVPLIPFVPLASLRAAGLDPVVEDSPFSS